jgi:uncharacterized protein with beta-barrel porin domain
MQRVSKFFLIAAILAAVCCAGVSPGLSQSYPDKGATPTPMWGTTFRYQDPISGAVFNDDGTNSQNPAVDAGSLPLGGVTYLLKTLQDTKTDFITFKGQKYTVYSAVPQNMTIDYAYKNASQYYDPNSLLIPGTTTKIIDFTIPATINGGNATDLAAGQPPSAPLTSDYTGEKVYLTKSPTDPNSLYFIPNLPNASGGHSGLTGNIYFVGDPFIGKSGFWPDTSVWPNGTFHLTPYGWASDPRFVANAYFVQLLDASGGKGGSTVLFEATPILRNFWKHSIQGYDYTYTGADPNDPTKYTVKRDILKALFAAIKTDPNYPFPAKAYQSGDYPSWLTKGGIYFHVQPQPGFQRNLLRFYTSWGAVDVYNQSSDLFVRPDGTIELPAVQDSSGKWRYAPTVTQTWDGSQRYTLLNLTNAQVPSTYDDYPGYEYYLPGNVYLPGKAGVVTAYVDYRVQDSTGLTARETDLWLGLKGDTANDMLFWADAPVSGKPTEPGGQGNKPYMFGGSTYLQGSTWNYYMRLQSSNSFCVAQLPQTDLQGKLYDASFYADLNNGKGYQKAATMTYQWQPWTIVDAGADIGKWVKNGDGNGAGVPQLTFADSLGGAVAVKASKTGTWIPGSRTMIWSDPYNVDPSNLSQDNNVVGGLLREYFATATTTDANTKFLIVLNPRTDWSGASGDWGTAANWSSGVPGDYNNVYLEQNDGVNRIVTYNNTAAAAPSLSMLRVDASGAGTMTLKVDSASPTGDLKAEMAIVGAANKGALLQTAGTVTLTDKLFLGYEKTANGTYTLQGGTLTTPNALVGVYGTGTFTQSGGTITVSDTLTIQANSGSTGTYTLSGGTFTVNHLINNGTFNRTGGTFNYNQMDVQGGNFVGDLDNTTILKGYGPITGKVTNSGTVSPGNSPGTLSIIGSYTQTATGNYVAEFASAGGYDKISVTGVTGKASLAGTITPTLLGGYRPARNQVFPGVITATGGVTGNFSTVANQQITPILSWQSRYNAASVDLAAAPNFANAGLGLTANQRRLGEMFNGVNDRASGDLGTVLDALCQLPTGAAVADAYKQISPEKAGAMSTLSFAGATLQMRNLAQRITDLRFGSRESGVLGGLPGSFDFNYSRAEGLMLAFNSSNLAGLLTSKRPAASEAQWGLYLDPSLILGSQESTVNQTGFNFNIAGFNAGADYRIRDDLLVGLATGYSHTGASFYGPGGGMQTNTWPLTAYAAYLPRSFYAYGSLGYALNLFNLQRQIGFGGLSRTATSSTAGNQFNAYGEAGYDFKAKPLVVTPVVSLAYSGIWVDSFTESGAGALNLKVSSQNAASVQTGLGAKVAAPLKLGSVMVVPQASATYQHEFANDSRGINASLSQVGSFNFTTDAAKKDFAVVGANVTLLTEKSFRVQVNYNADVGRGNYIAHAINAGLRWEF